MKFPLPLIATVLAVLCLSPSYAALLAVQEFGGGTTNQPYVTPLLTTYMECIGQGAGGAGSCGLNNLGGGGGGRGGMGDEIAYGTLGGLSLIVNVGHGGFASVCPNYGNVGTQSSVTFPGAGGWMWIWGGAQRALGQMAGQGGNNAQSGTQPSYVFAWGQANLGSEIGQNAVGTLGGIGAGNGDTGGGGNGGAPGQNGTAGIDGYISCRFYD